MIKEENGFSTPLAMIIIFTLCLSLSSLSLLVFVKQKNVLAYKNYYEMEKKAESICSQVLIDFQDLKNKKDDYSRNEIINEIFSNYSDFRVELSDISTAINTKFLKPEIIENDNFQVLLNKYGDDIQTSYGWIKPQYADSKFISDLHNDFGDKSLFPIVNGLPFYNVYFMNRDFLECILKWRKIENVNEKAEEIKKLIESNDLTYEKMCLILGKNSNDSIFDFLGTKTSFWKIVLDSNEISLSIVVAGIPDESNSRKIEKYVLIEKDINIKGGLL